jgi:hypothetical protein
MVGMENPQPKKVVASRVSRYLGIAAGNSVTSTPLDHVTQNPTHLNPSPPLLGPMLALVVLDQ